MVIFVTVVVCIYRPGLLGRREKDSVLRWQETAFLYFPILSVSPKQELSRTGKS